MPVSLFAVLAAADARELAHRMLEGLTAQAAGAAGGSMTSTLGFLAVMGVIMYLMMIRPQQKQAKEHRTMLTSLKKGDVIVTTGGIVARIHTVAEKFLVIEAGRDVKMRLLPSAVATKAPEGLMDEEPRPVEAKSEAKGDKEKEK
jgi:preprotein translocase subunit YajC